MHRDRTDLAALRPEVRVLALSAGPPSVDGELRALLASPSIDWEVLSVLADAERATAVVWRRIRPLVPPSIPDQVRERFERMALVADFTSSYLEQRAGETFSRLASLGVEPIVLKGVALALGVYGSFSERPMGDIDVLVDAEQSDATWRGAQEAGWEWVASRYPLVNYVGHAHLPPLLDVRGRILRLEVHSALFVEGSPFVLSATEIRVRGSVTSFGAGRVVIPCREHLLLHACIHFAWSHMMSFGSWRTFRDVLALQAAGIDWALFEEEARRNRAESSAYWTLRLTERLAGGSFPAETMARLGRSAGLRWAGACDRHLQRELFPVGERCPSQQLRRWLWEAAIQPTGSGHGTMRPWILDEAAVTTAPAESEGGGESGRGEARRRRRHLRRVGELWRYARMLAG